MLSVVEQLFNVYSSTQKKDQCEVRLFYTNRVQWYLNAMIYFLVMDDAIIMKKKLIEKANLAFSKILTL